MEEDPEEEPHGHITSLAVKRSYRRLGALYFFPTKDELFRIGPKIDGSDSKSHGGNV